MKLNKKAQKQGMGVIACEEIRAALPAYMLRELGEKQSVLFHEHLRLCDACRQEAARYERMHALLRAQQSDVRQEHAVLSDTRLARLRFTAMHPVFDWVYFRHRLVSGACAVVLLLLLLLLLRNYALFREPAPEETIPIWRMIRSGRLPELVEEAARQYAAPDAAEPGAGSAAAEGAP